MEFFDRNFLSCCKKFPAAFIFMIEISCAVRNETFGALEMSDYSSNTTQRYRSLPGH